MAETAAPLSEGGHPELVCPACRAGLELRPSGSHRCLSCQRTYPEVAGIPDLRLTSDRYLSLDQDRAKAEKLAGMDGASFHELMQEYWRMTPEVPAALAAAYASAAADGVRRGERWLGHTGAPPPGGSVLDVGCGTGGLVVAAAQQGSVVTGVDIALRWLVIARRRCEEEGVPVRLVGADGAVLPFRQGAFDLTVSLETLEHASGPRALLQSCLLATRQGGTAWLTVSNRFSILPDPATGLCGLGYLPRRVAVWYVARRRHTRYAYVRPLSAGHLRALVGLRSDVKVTAAPLPAPPAGASRARILAHTAYDGLVQQPWSNRVLARIGPLLQVSGRVGRA